MAFPTEADVAVLKVGDGGGPETFTVVCGIEGVQFSETTNTTDRFRRDCAKPGATPSRNVFSTGYQWDLTGTGVLDTNQLDTLKGVLGISNNWQVELLQKDGSDAGVSLGVFEGQAVLTSTSINSNNDGATLELTLAGEGDLDWDANS